MEELSYHERRKLLRKRSADLQALGFRFTVDGTTLKVETMIDVLGTQLTLDSKLLAKIDSKGSVRDFMHEIFKSKACRYAIKFGDRVDAEDCLRLVQLTFDQCKRPFVCCHGRPTVHPIYIITTAAK